MRTLTIGAATAIAVGVIVLPAAAHAATPVATTHDVGVSVSSANPVELPALNSQFTKMVLTPSGENHWNYGDAEHVTGYNASGNEWTNFPYTQGHVVWNGTEYAPLVGEGTQAGGMLYRVDGGAWRALDKVTSVTVAQGTHVQVVSNDRPSWFFDNTGSLNVHVVRTK